MRRHHQIVILYDQIVNRRHRQIQLQWLPMRAVIERNEDAELCSRVEQTFAFRIFAHRVDIGAIGIPVHDRAPAFPRSVVLKMYGLKSSSLCRSTAT